MITSFLRISAFLFLIPITAQAQSVQWPAKPVTLVVGAAPGGSTDIVARAIGKRLQDAINQPVMVDNKPAGGGVIAYAFVAKAPADGYTLAVLSSTLTTGAAVRTNLPYDALKSFKPVAMVARGPLVVAVSADSPYKSMGELLSAARANPGKLNYGTSGSGSINHFATELIMETARIKMTHIPYKGMAPAVTDLLGGQIQVLVAAAPSILSHVKSGRVRALAVTTATRSSVAPEIPSLEQVGLKDGATDLWWGVLAPAGTPAPVVMRLNAEINKILATPELKEFLLKEGAEPATMKPDEFQTFIAAEVDHWKKVAKAADIRDE